MASLPLCIQRISGSVGRKRQNPKLSSLGLSVPLHLACDDPYAKVPHTPAPKDGVDFESGLK